MRVALIEVEKMFSIEVGDDAVVAAAESSPESNGAASSVEPADAEGDMGLAVISGLVDDVEVSSDGSGGLIRMSWPTAADPVLP